MSEKLPDNFDWVVVRAACSASVQLLEVHRLIERNVLKRNEQVGSPQRFGINVLRADPLYFKVFDSQNLYTSVDFSLQGEAIQVEAKGRTHQVTLTLDDDGRCRLNFEDEPLDVWQLVKRLLEPLFFGDK